MYERNQMTEKQRDRRTMILLGLEAVGLIAAAVVVSFIAGGCGEKRQEGVTASAGPSAVASTPDAAVAAVTPGRTVETPPQETDPVAYADSLPPEVAVSVADAHVLPGEAVEITAEGSADVTDVLLSDGAGKPQAFVYDLGGKVWRTFYRVPMKRSLDRVALSVTAKNGTSHWRRVWLFLEVEHETGATPPDSTSQR